VPTRTPRRVPIRRPLVAAALVTLLASAGVAAIGQTSEAVPQQATITVLPGIVQPGKLVANADKALSAVIATFVPAKKGRTVELQKKVGSKWVEVATGVQDRAGKVEFAAPSGSVTKPITYRAVAAKSSSLRTVASRAVATSQWGPATFTDQFAGSALSANWVHRMQFYQPASMRNCSKGDPSAVRVASGTLRLSVIRDPSMAPGSCTASKYDGTVIGNFDYRLNGHVSTEGHQYLKYGVVAARIKFQRRQGQHASLWMQPQDPTYIPNAFEGGAEIDIIEYFGDGVKNGGLTSFIYSPMPSGLPAKIGGWIKKPERYLSEKKDGWSKRYHVFSVEWSPSAYVFRIDGRESARITTGISGVPQFPILSLLSSDYELKKLKGEFNLPQTMSVDWIRFWQAPTA
jgi:beta-glucanase (GH16 family)